MAREEDRRIDLERFARLLDSYGADPERWPAAEREGARELFATSSEAAEMHKRAAALDGLLGQASSLEPSPELVARILAAASPPGWRRLAQEFWPFGPLWRPLSALAASALLGVAVGIAAPPPFPDGTARQSELNEEISMLALGPDIELEDLP